MNKLGIVSFFFTYILIFSTHAMATVVTVIQDPLVPFQWSVSAGTPEIVDVTGEGGDLENNAPAGTGVLKLDTTGGVDKSEVVLQGPFGTVSDFIGSTGTISFDYYQQSGAPLSTIAPAFKFSVFDADFAGDGFATFIYEPYYQVFTSPPKAANTDPVKDVWTHVEIDLDTGFFWHTGIYGDPAASDYDNTINDWISQFGVEFENAFIWELFFGIGSGTPDQVGYIDNIQFSEGQFSQVYDFELETVPLPAALPLYATSLAIFGAVGWRRRRNKNI